MWGPETWSLWPFWEVLLRSLTPRNPGTLPENLHFLKNQLISWHVKCFLPWPTGDQAASLESHSCRMQFNALVSLAKKQRHRKAEVGLPHTSFQGHLCGFLFKLGFKAVDDLFRPGSLRPCQRMSLKFFPPSLQHTSCNLFFLFFFYLVAAFSQQLTERHQCGGSHNLLDFFLFCSLGEGLE